MGAARGRASPEVIVTGCDALPTARHGMGYIAVHGADGSTPAQATRSLPREQTHDRVTQTSPRRCKASATTTPPAMTTATLITQTGDRSYELDCGNRTVHVWNGESFLNVYVGSGVGTGRVFHQETVAERLAAAVASYKAAAVKTALEALADYLA